MLNKVMLIGNVGKEPDMKFTANGTARTIFSVAVNEKFKKEDGTTSENTQWFNIVTWRQTAEFCSQYVKKGAKVYVEGKMSTRSWEGSDGQKHYTTEIIASSVLLLERLEKKTEEINEEDLPF